MVSLKDSKRKPNGLLTETGDGRIRISFYPNRNESKKDKKMAETRLEVSLLKLKPETGVDTGGRVKEKVTSSKGDNLEEFKVYAQLQNYKFAGG